MKFILYICFCFIFSVFHAGAMPIGNMDNQPMDMAVDMEIEIEMEMETQTQTSMIDHEGFHCENIMQGELEMQQCCSGTALQLVSLFPAMEPANQEMFVPLPSLLIEHIPNTLFKPPKSHS